MKRLWADAGVQECVATATEASVPEKRVVLTPVRCGARADSSLSLDSMS